MEKLSCFKAYDIRGRLGTELNEHIAFCIGRAFAQYLQPKQVALGADVRATSERLKLALAFGLITEGVSVIDLGMTGTEEVYFAAQYLDIQGAIEVTASHNPIDYNGMKLVRENARPISGDTGLVEIKQRTSAFLEQPFAQDAFEQFCQQCAAVAPEQSIAIAKAEYARQSILQPYIAKMLSFIDLAKLAPLKLVVNAGNGAAGHVVDAIEQQFIKQNIPITFIKLQHHADASFPNGIPNPLLIENRTVTAEAVLRHKADMGIAWDGDFDRCFLFDHQGRFIEGYYIVGLLASAFLQQQPGAKIIHDPRLYWNTQAIVTKHGGQSILCKTGHAFIKERMRTEDAIYGGEMSAHHYFKDFAYCDSGMIPWLLVAELMSTSAKSLSNQVANMISEYPSSGELNFTLNNPEYKMNVIKKKYSYMAKLIDYTDGITMEFDSWRFNIRLSNTESVLRLNVESKQNYVLMKQMTAEIISILTAAE
ncbi:phosphohexomutase domain-containing protein [Rheinheimera salexigens]|uniref:phosphomannomutase n=1 Tax=Rheinheimera salexigens TaxID=1628148 RepID=A0A1E7Q8D3_9GAMM|nr:phosphomannomutase [Rheinheimera salexigens]OEY70397.1 phosphomannomutase [Rheinheimera salexigens]